MKTSIILITLFLYGCFLSCNNKLFMQDHQGQQMYIDKDNYPLVVNKVFMDEKSKQYVHKFENFAWGALLADSFAYSDSLVFIKKSYLDSLLKK